MPLGRMRWVSGTDSGAGGIEGLSFGPWVERAALRPTVCAQVGGLGGLKGLPLGRKVDCTA